MEIVNDSGLAPAYLVGSVRSKGPTLTFLVKGSFRLVPDGLAEPEDEPAFPHGDLFYEDDPDERGAQCAPQRYAARGRVRGHVSLATPPTPSGSAR